MAPAADMSTVEGMAQCFSLANMIPQAPKNNQKAWSSIEKATRKYIKRADGDVYVITGPVFDINPSTMGRIVYGCLAISTNSCMTRQYTKHGFTGLRTRIRLRQASRLVTKSW